MRGMYIATETHGSFVRSFVRGLVDAGVLQGVPNSRANPSPNDGGLPAAPPAPCLPFDDLFAKIAMIATTGPTRTRFQRSSPMGANFCSARLARHRRRKTRRLAIRPYPTPTNSRRRPPKTATTTQPTPRLPMQ